MLAPSSLRSREPPTTQLTRTAYPSSIRRATTPSNSRKFTVFAMTRKKSSKPKGETRTTFTYPSLNYKVVTAVSDQISSIWYQRNDSPKGYQHEYSTHVMGKFTCDNRTCDTTGWSSKKVAILIRGYPRNGYNALVFNQRCKACNQLGSFTMDEQSYVDRVTYRIKKWAGVPTGRPEYGGGEGPPHESQFCDGCRRGICRQAGGGQMFIMG